MAGIEQRNGCVWYYGNPAGYIDRDSAVMDVIFQNDELERWLQKNHLLPRWTDGVYERLSSGGRPKVSGTNSATPIVAVSPGSEPMTIPAVTPTQMMNRTPGVKTVA